MQHTSFWCITNFAKYLVLGILFRYHITILWVFVTTLPGLFSNEFMIHPIIGRYTSVRLLLLWTPAEHEGRMWKNITMHLYLTSNRCQQLRSSRCLCDDACLHVGLIWCTRLSAHARTVQLVRSSYRPVAEGRVSHRATQVGL